MVSRTALPLALALLVVSAGPSPAHPVREGVAPGPDAPVAVQELLRAELDAGRIDLEDWLLQNFRLVWAPERGDARWTGRPWMLESCFTPWVAEFVAHRDELSAAAVAEIEGYLAPPVSSLARATYVSPSGHFELHYETAGADAVPLDDVAPANGIPDFVERCAEYYDTAWATEIDALGFAAPLLPGDGTYDCYFQAFSPGLYGVTSTVGVGRTQITIDNDFLGFGHVPSPDPDGAQLGRAKGVIAHEFKHASQYTQSSWTESYWVELDANWIMDIVFDESDIYHAWLTDPTSQLRSPQTRLDNTTGDVGNYEDLLWETYLGERFGVQFLVDFGARRAGFSFEDTKKSYQETLFLYGSEWDDAYPGYMEWCWFTGSRSEPGVGFEEAADMSRMNLLAPAVTSYPYAVGTSVDRLAAHHRRFNPPAGATLMEVRFDGDDTHENFAVSILTKALDGTVTIQRPALDAANDLVTLVDVASPPLEYFGVIVTNARRRDDAKAYTLEVSTSGAEDAPLVAPASRLALDAAGPNPFRDGTRLAFATPSPGRARLAVFDVAGRRVRTLLDREVPAGDGGSVAWDGRDDAGRPLPAGVYWARLETRDGTVSRPVTQLR